MVLGHALNVCCEAGWMGRRTWDIGRGTKRRIAGKANGPSLILRALRMCEVRSMYGGTVDKVAKG